MATEYVHGYAAQEAARLIDQASTLTDLLHFDTSYPAGSLVFEAGCGVGAQTVALAARSPQATFVSVDISPVSLRRAKARVEEAGLRNVTFQEADILSLPFSEAHFDHAFVCFVLEHLARPDKALDQVRRVLRPGGTLTVIEGDHGSRPTPTSSLRDVPVIWRPRAACVVRLYPTRQAESERCDLTRIVRRRRRPVDGFIRKTFTAMVEGVGDQAISQGLIEAESWRKGIRDLYRTAEADGTFCYTFFKAIGLK
jgi:SAM-dependent methyltransferase